jgi:hypothetical protein
VSEKQFYDWKKRKSLFTQAIDIADARALEVATKNIKDLGAAKGDWKAWQYLASVKDPRYKEKSEIEHKGTPMVVIDNGKSNKVKTGSDKTPTEPE